FRCLADCPEHCRRVHSSDSLQRTQSTPPLVDHRAPRIQDLFERPQQTGICPLLSLQRPFQRFVFAERFRPAEIFLKLRAASGQILDYVFNSFVWYKRILSKDACVSADRLANDGAVLFPEPFSKGFFSEALIFFDQMNAGEVGSEKILGGLWLGSNECPA